MRVFFDTNVLASAFATRGLCADVVETVVADHVLVTSEAVLAELEGVLYRRFHLPRDRRAAILAFLRRHHVEPTPETLPRVPLRDQVPIPIADPRGVWNLLRGE